MAPVGSRCPRRALFAEVFSNRSAEIVVEYGAADELDHSGGNYAVLFLDPDGIKLELAHTPATG